MKLPQQERYARQLYKIARSQSRGILRSEDDREDCAMEFVGRMLRMHDLEPEEKKYQANGWLKRCAYRHTLNWGRDLRRREPLSQPFPPDLVDTLNTPEEIYLCGIFWQHLAQMLSQLGERPRRLFVGFYFLGHTTNELAQKYEMLPNAVEQSLLRSRRRLRGLLEKRGWNDAAVLEHLATVSVPSGLSFLGEISPPKK